MSCAEFTELGKQTCTSSMDLLGVGDEFHGRSKLEMRRRGKDGPLLNISDFSRASPPRGEIPRSAPPPPPPSLLKRGVGGGGGIS